MQGEEGSKFFLYSCLPYSLFESPELERSVLFLAMSTSAVQLVPPPVVTADPTAVLDRIAVEAGTND